MLIFGAKIQTFFIIKTKDSLLTKMSNDIFRVIFFSNIVHDLSLKILHLPDANISEVIKMTMN